MGIDESMLDLVLDYVPTVCQFRLDTDETYCCSEPIFLDSLCLFHTPKFAEAEKRQLPSIEQHEAREVEFKFRRKLTDLIRLREDSSDYDRIDLRGFRFPKIEFPKLFSKTVDFTRCVFVGDVSFEHTEFKAEACFQLATFLADVSFQGAKFRKKADFYITTFGQEGSLSTVSFLNATFDQGASFSAATFYHLAQFSGATFDEGGSAMFFDTRFNDHAAFSDTIFKDQTIFKAKFKKEANFVRSKFLSQAKFSETTFDRSADFRSAEFLSADFGRSVFQAKGSFYEASFANRADFGDVTFAQMSDFAFTTFGQGAHFSFSRFLGDLSCKGSAHRNKSNFMSCEFRGATDWRGATFSDDVIFMGAIFHGQADFVNSVFEKKLMFRNVSLHGEAKFMSTVGPGCFMNECDFRDLRVIENGRLLFKGVNLALALFANTNLEEALFSDVQWHRHKANLAPWLRRVQSLWDEFRPTAQKERDRAFYEALAENYRQLVLNYEQKRDYENAENFHIGELEMRRKMKGAEIKPEWASKVRSWLNGYSVYRISSNYGTSYIQGLLILLVLTMSFSAAFLYAGFKTTNTDDHNESAIEYNVFSDSRHSTATVSQWVSDYLSAVSLSVAIMTFQQDRPYEPSPGIARFWLYVATIALAGQSALVLLAVRRRFRR